MSSSTSSQPVSGPAVTRPPLRRPRDGRIIVGVCAGLARSLGVSPLIVRLITLAVGVAVPPFALIAYAGLALAMPRDDGRALLGGAPDDSRETIIGWSLIVMALIAIATGIGSSMFGGPGGLVVLAGGIVLLVVHHQRGAPQPPAMPTPAAAPEPDAQPVARRTIELPYPGPVGAAMDPAVATIPLAARPDTGAAMHVPAPALPREPSIGLYGVAAVLGAGAAAIVLGALDVIDVTGRNLAVGLGIGALALTAAAIVFARRRGAVAFVVLAVLLALGALGSVAVGTHVEHGIGDRTEFLVAPSDLGKEYRLGIGQLTIDLSQSAIPDGTSTVRARLGIGELRVRVPRGVRVISDGPSRLGGLGFVNDAAGSAPEKTLRIIADVDHGSATVSRVEP